MNPLQIGLIGFGSWPQQAYAPILKGLDSVRVVAVAARSESTRALATETFGDAVQTYASWADLLASDAVEAVMLALPNPIHAEALLAVIEAGKHVFFEPPIGLGDAEVLRALDAAESASTIVQTDFELRHVPALGFVRGLFASGKLGRPLMAKMRLWCDWGLGGCEWLDEVESQGFFPWLGTWYLDVLDAIFDAPAVSAHVAAGYAMNRTLMDHGSATIQFEGGGLGEFELNMVAVDGQEVVVSVLGTAGEIVADLWSGDCRRRAKDGVWHEQNVPCSQPICGFSGMRESIVAFVDSVQTGAPMVPDMQAIRRVHELTLACARSEAEKREVMLSEF